MESEDHFGNRRVHTRQTLGVYSIQMVNCHRVTKKPSRDDELFVGTRLPPR